MPRPPRSRPTVSALARFIQRQRRRIDLRGNHCGRPHSSSPARRAERPGFFDGNVLKRGRAYFASDLRFRPELASPDFMRWADRVLTRIKKLLTREPEIAPSWIYLSASALQWIRDQDTSADGGGRRFARKAASGNPATVSLSRLPHGIGRETCAYLF